MNRTPLDEEALRRLLEHDLNFVIDQIAELEPPAPLTGNEAWQRAVITVCRATKRWRQP